MFGFSKKQPTPSRRRNSDDSLNDRNKPSDGSMDQRYAFRRNRTLTGSSSSQIHTVNDMGADLKSPRIKAHELVYKRRRIGAVLLGVLLASAMLVVAITQFTAQVTVASSRDASLHLDDSYEDLIDNYFSKYPVERFRFFLDEEKLLAYLQSQAPEIFHIKQDTTFGLGETSFLVGVRKPVVAWRINGQQRFVDTNGVSFAKNYFSLPAVQIIDKSGIEVNDGQAIASNRFLGFIGRSIGALSSHGLNVQNVEIPNRTTRQIKLKIKGVEYPIIMSVDRGAGEQAEDAARAVAWMKSRNIKPSYIDVRVSRRAFYRI